jgi:hypothetical protein
MRREDMVVDYLDERRGKAEKSGVEEVGEEEGEAGADEGRARTGNQEDESRSSRRRRWTNRIEEARCLANSTKMWNAWELCVDSFPLVVGEYELLGSLP